jgi:ketosteroid isomerase-like protein
MAFDPGAVARAFSEHRFDEALGFLAKDVRWTIVGYMVLEGADAVRQTCRETAASLEDTTTTYDRCVVADGADVVAVDTVARYSGPGGVTAVASCDIYEFVDEEIRAITSYAVEVDPDSAGSQPPPRGTS